MTADDQAVRDRALSGKDSFIVQAPAGSGKTELLIQRYLNLLGEVREPEEIVAITFTRKAAAEMHERVVDALRGAAAGHAGGQAAEARRFELARRAMDNDRRHGWELLHHPARLQIQTIDALCLALTRQLPFLSGFTAPSGIVDDARAAYQRAAADTIRLLGGLEARWREALRRFLIHLDNDMTRATALLAEMLASRDQWLRHLGDAGTDPDNLETAWQHVVEADLRRIHALFPEALKAALVECATAAAEQLAGESDGDASGARAWLDGPGGFPEPRADQLPCWRFLADLTLTRSGDWRRTVNKNQGFPPKSAAKLAMQTLLAALADRDDVLVGWRPVATLPDPRFDREYTEVLEALMTVLKLAVAQLQLVFDESGEVDFVEVTQRALAALGALEDPSDLALKLDYQIQHLLVDEFQDTSIAQYHLLRLLTQGWTPDDGKTLFLVGDPMQSIYRFREAEVGVFLRVWEDGLGDVPVEPLRLWSNFRSSAPVVEWVNHAFSRCFPDAPDPDSGAVAYATSTPRREIPDDGAQVHVHPFVNETDAGQAESLAALLQAALGRSRDVAVLVRARSHLQAILPALQAHGIPYSGMEVTALINEPAVRDLYSLTRALLHPGDRMAWLSLLRAPWCGLVLADLLAVAHDPQVPVWTALRDPVARAGVSADGLARVDRLTGALEAAIAQRGRLTLRQWTRRAWIALDGPALAGVSGIQHAREYFDLLGRHQAGMALADAAAFDEALRGHWAHSEAPAGAVQLMTVHRAKGLEFDEVFLPALDRAVPSDDKRLLLWEEPLDGAGLLLATLSERGSPDDGHYQYLRRLQGRKSANETDRLFYVACTRARNRLHLLANLNTRDGELRPPRDDSLLQRVWSSVERDFAGATPAAPEQPAQGELNLTRSGQPLRRLPAGWTAPACPEALPGVNAAPVEERHVEFSWAGETVRHVGILVHEIMQRIALDGLARWDEDRVDSMLPSWRERLAHIGVTPGQLDDAARRTGDAIRNLLRDERAAWLLRAHQDRADEYELSVVAGGRVRRLRIDRTFVDEQGARWIVDYKTSAHEGGNIEAFLDREQERYREQLEGYADAFRKTGAGEIRLGLYFPLLKGWREWRFPD